VKVPKELEVEGKLAKQRLHLEDERLGVSLRRPAARAEAALPPASKGRYGEGAGHGRVYTLWT